MKTQDILLFDQQLSEEEISIQNSARDYCQSELMPRILEANRNETFDKNIYKEMGEMGFLGAPISGYGCAGVNYVSYGIIAREIERVDSSYRSLYSVQTSLAMYAIYQFGTEEQKKEGRSTYIAHAYEDAIRCSLARKSAAGWSDCH